MSLHKPLSLVAVVSLSLVVGSGVATAQPTADFDSYEIPNKTGKAADDLKLTYDRIPFGGLSDKFKNQPNLSGKTITFSGGPVNNNQTDKGVVMFDKADKAKQTSLLDAEWSFPDPDGAGPLPKPPNEKAPSPKVEKKDGKKSGNSLDGFMDIFNDESVPIFITNFLLAKDVPASLFGTSDSALQDLIDNDLFIGLGVPVAAPSSFSLLAGEVRRFEMGDVTADGFLVTVFEVGFSPTLMDLKTGHASSGVPEPASLLLLSAGLVGLAGGAAWRRRQRR